MLAQAGVGLIGAAFHRDCNCRIFKLNEVGNAGSGMEGGKNLGTAFRFAQEGSVNVFYWVNGPFGYAISAHADKAELARVSGEAYRQLGTGR